MRTFLLACLLLPLVSCYSQDTDSLLLGELVQKINDRSYPLIDGIVVERGDQIILEEYFNGIDRNERHDIRSAFKSITSLLTGIAIDQGLLALDDPLSKFFPELQNTAKGKITIQNLLEMRSGLNCEEFYGIGPECEGDMFDSKDWVGYCLQVPLIRQPGLNWSYSSNDPMILGAVIARAAGTTIMAFAREYLFKPLDIREYTWQLSPKGKGMTAGSFRMRPIDMLKIAKLVHLKGTWKGRQIVSEAWIEKSTRCAIDIDFSFTRYSRFPHAKYESAYYGFYWYREKLQYRDIQTEVLFASGNGGNYMMILPEYDAKVVFTGSNYGNWRGKLPFEMLLKYIIPVLQRG